ncbi:bifunctional 5,10-methylenetetrahydrofolate dehydrogenase/5,10-methenyltetrahydrofolate cyclohydrolase [Candidatus Kaiserbacteria bacterium]|nr:bifunctional 5,10-methylenetetrahydrofolate dehydrogenase/5,10-methenyltetrahydrofolate cyclohydrolase [Candidatus Kaiserbacteria bacterium]
MVVDGRAIAESVYAELGAQLHGVRLGIVMSAGDAVTDSYVRIKARAAERLGVVVVVRELSENAMTAQVQEAVQYLVEEGVDGIIVQLPLPTGVDTGAVLATIPGDRDVDGLTQDARVHPPVACAVEEILAYAGVEPVGKSAVVVGAGRLVGAPVARMLRERGALVTVVDKGDSYEPLSTADIVVSGAGVPGLIQSDMIKEGVVLIDAGTSELGGKVVGDIDPECEEKASVYTPVPGGAGPIAVAMIFKNLIELIEKKNSSAN